jgi:hypothetical protein
MLMLDQFGYPDTFPFPGGILSRCPRIANPEWTRFSWTSSTAKFHISRTGSVQYEDSHNIQNRAGCAACYSFFLNAAVDCDANWPIHGRYIGRTIEWKLWSISITVGELSDRERLIKATHRGFIPRALSHRYAHHWYCIFIFANISI